MDETTKRCDGLVSQIEQTSSLLLVSVAKTLHDMLAEKQSLGFADEFRVGRHFTCHGFRRYRTSTAWNNFAYELYGNIDGDDMTVYVPVCRLDPGETVDLYTALKARRASGSASN